ncbi:MAG: glycoside hydrolase family 2 TIM barrel-domain containing protein, partial [Armatimonadota bacterium]
TLPLVGPAFLLAMLCLQQNHAMAQAVPVRVVSDTSGRWQMLRGGKPYFVNGAGGNQKLELLKASGGNSIRTWGVETAKNDLDAAHKLGLTATIGIWLGHKEHGFRYDDPKAVADQLAKAREAVIKYKDHPALLAWGLGNEMEGDGKDPNVWKAVEEIARMVKQVDPNHPTLTVIAELGADGIKAKQVKELCPSIDVLGVNSYGGAASLATRLKASGWTKPYMVTEFGPNGPWEVGKTSWGAPLEPTSTEKARDYMARYTASVSSQKGWCLGSYVFLWGDKVEGTPTWFGMFLPGTGERLGTVDTMMRVWVGSPSPRPVPEISAVISSAARKEVAPGSRQTVTVSASGSGPLTTRYEIRREMGNHNNHEPGQSASLSSTGIVPSASTPSTEQFFNTPTQTGAYRLFITVHDKNGGAATANIPFFVKS